MAQPEIKIVDKGFGVPRLNEGDLPGYKPKQMLERAPYVKDASGHIWQYEPWMADMGDVLQPCWEAPPKPRIMVASSPLDIEHYGKQLPQNGEQMPKAPRRASTKKKRKGGGRKRPPMPRGPYGSDAGTGST